MEGTPPEISAVLESLDTSDVEPTLDDSLELQANNAILKRFI